MEYSAPIKNDHCDQAIGYSCQYHVVFCPKSKTCSNCLMERTELPLRIREWQCLVCGAVHDRDVNAAQNIARVGLKQMEKVGREPPEPKTPVE